MHRMLCLTAKVGLLWILTSVLNTSATAELIQSPGGRAYPDLAGAITGTQSYNYDPSTETGSFQVTNTPYLLTTGPAVANESIVQPDIDGIRTQMINLTLDRNGQLVNSANNSYSLYGTVNVGGQTFSGLLLKGTPTAFGPRAEVSSAFNLDMRVTGGVLASAFGPDLYMELHPALDSTFDGNFGKSFTTTIDSSNTLGYRAPLPAPIPEPSTLVVLLACGAGIVFHRRLRRLASKPFERPEAEAS